MASQPYGLPLNETIMPQFFQKLGYRRHMVGKVGLLIKNSNDSKMSVEAVGFFKQFLNFPFLSGTWDSTRRSLPQCTEALRLIMDIIWAVEITMITPQKPMR